MKTTEARIPSTNGTGKKTKKNSNGLSENPEMKFREPFNSRELLRVLTEVKNGDFNVRMPIDEIGLGGKINDTINQMILNLHKTTLRNQNQDWLKSNLVKFAELLVGQKDLSTVTTRILSELAHVVNAHYGAFYILKIDEITLTATLKLSSGYAYKNDINIQKEFSMGEGLVGQCAFEKRRIVITNVPKGYVKVSSALGKAIPVNLVILPVLFEKNVKAVIELASLDSFTETHLAFLGQLTESIGIVLNSIETFSTTQLLLKQAQLKAGELSIANKELAFQNNEKEKRAAELGIANKELAYQNDEREKRAAELSVANEKIEESRKSLESKAQQLALISKYKSEFLANMSHELRSPLNSLLILAQQLYENMEGNLSDKQVRYAKTIHSCGEDLIQLINNILDLSKIESGIISTNISTVRIAEITSFIETTYKPIAETRNLQFSIETDTNLPATMDTDMMRINQVLKNLLSNAFKFTEKGEVSLKIAEAKANWKPGHPMLDKAKRVVSFSVSDTGIGIPPEKQLIIFEAFQQAEGSTSRKYGGTGLGLSISRGLVDLLGGSIEVKSKMGHGSTFTLFLPLETTPNVAPHESPLISKVIPKAQPKKEEVRNYLSGSTRTMSDSPEKESIETDTESDSVSETGDDRANIKADEKVVLIVEDDLRFGKIMIEKAHENSLKAIVATNYMDVFKFINRFAPMAITLDVNLPDTTGWKIIQMLRSDLLYCHIPIHVISGEENRVMALKRGARSFLLKPLENGLLNQLFSDMISYDAKDIKHILIVEDSDIDASQIAKMLTDEKIKITIATTCQAAIVHINTIDYDCIILDYTLPDVSGTDLIHEINKAKKLFTPVIVYSVKDFTNIEMNNVNFNSNSHITKGVKSTEYLLAETVSQLHINHKALAPEKRKIIEHIRSKKDILNNKNILVVDDDVRNLFAMTTVFERFNMQVVMAESGQEAIDILMKNSKIEMVLMDIMMPDKDGYETIAQIRHTNKNPQLPIIAVTAKAMKRDREKCIEAGASDYITKPVKIDQLLSLMRLWFCK